MAKRVLAAIFIFISSSLAHAQSCSDLASAHPAFKWAGSQPLLLLTEYNPWAMVIGSDSPTFALYADGTVIYWLGEGRSGKYVTATLASSEIGDLLKLAHVNDVDGFRSCYAIADYTDAPTNVLVVKTKTGYKTIEVYGVIRHIENISPDRMPTSLQETFRVLLAFTNPKAHDWNPPYLEVMMWPFSYAKSSLSWPAYFPGTHDKNARQSAQRIELFLPLSDLSRYEAFVSKLKPTTAVLLDGKKWAISQRLPFPHEGKP
ncbi:hypothetical protein P8935_03375 [Telmatobacter sp. DSM 110680]|uniref:Uncharacterized protein n=1 Tax=Telmatobacter sp. DSM 110680 TaxID=3036704 RepID=A0AAU7DMV5_9BACT